MMSGSCQCNTNNLLQHRRSSSTTKILRECSSTGKMVKGCLPNGIDKCKPSVKKTQPAASPCRANSLVQKKGKTWLQTLYDTDSQRTPQNGSPETQKLKYNPSFNPHCGGEIESFIGSDEENKKIKHRAIILVDIFHSEIKDLDDRKFLQLLTDCKNLSDIRNGTHKSCASVKEYVNKINGEQQTKKQQPRTSQLTEAKTGSQSVRSKLIDAQGHLSTTGIMMKGFSNLLKNFDVVNKQASDQRIMLENLTLFVSQLREENKMLNQVKDIKRELETELATMISENKEVKEKLEKTERSCEEYKKLLEKREKDVENLVNDIKYLKTKVSGKISKGIQYLEDPSIELPAFNDTIASLPNHQESFNMLIRPASSSPTHEVNIRNRDVVEPWLNGQDSAEIKSKNQSNDKNCRSFRKVQENVKRLTENLEAEKKNDISANLSDVTYQWSA